MNADDESDETVKPLFWIAGSLRDLREFPEDVRRIMGFGLWQAQQGGKHIDAKPLKGFGGAAVLEIVADDDGSTYRGVYTVKFARVVYVLHAFQKRTKKGAKTPKQEVDVIHRRLRAAAEHYGEWCRSRPEEKQ